MSSPFGHSIAGYLIYSCKSKNLRPQNYRELLLFIFVANVPDLDFLPGIIIGTPNLYHHGISHSLGFAFIVSLLLTQIVQFSSKHTKFKTNFLYFFGTYSSHLFLDYISVDARPPLGIPIFWPLTNEYFICPYPILPPVSHAQSDYAGTAEVFSQIFSIHNLHVIMIELTITIPFFLLLFIYLKSLSHKY